MKKWPFIILCILFVSCKKQTTNWAFSLDKNSTEPFGCFLAYDRLDDLFPNANKYTVYHPLDEMTKEIDKSYFSEQNHLRIIVAAYFNPTEKEIKTFKSYVEKGGNILLMSYYSLNLDSIFAIEKTSSTNKKDSMHTYTFVQEEQLKAYEFKIDQPYYYFSKTSGKVLGYQETNKHKEVVTLLQKVGDGTIIHSSVPETFTNYFLLNQHNIQYYEWLLSQFPASISKVAWYSDLSYYGQKPSESSSNFWKLLEHKSFRYAFYTFMALILLYVFFEGKRRQRIIPILPSVKNESLEFTETIGRLYYKERDHANLARKMLQYYLEQLRSNYGLNTQQLDKEFALKLSRKINKNVEDTEQFVQSLQQVNTKNFNETELINLYHQLKKYS